MQGMDTRDLYEVRLHITGLEERVSNWRGAVLEVERQGRPWLRDTVQRMLAEAESNLSKARPYIAALYSRSDA
jgi:hypothetical protein